MSETDDHLMALLRAGDSRAFAELYERYRTPVFTFLVRLTGNHHLAEDLLQETFLRLYRGRAAYQPTGRFHTWLFTIARRLAVDYYRRQHAAWDREPDAIEASDRAEHRAETRELLERVDRALRRLSPAQREVVLLSRFAGMNAADIGLATGSTPGAVRVTLHRALRRLQSLLEEASSRQEAPDPPPGA